MARAACAAAALDGRSSPLPWDVECIAPHAVMHRRRNAAFTDTFAWSQADREKLAQVISAA
jgi:hypothetical protein